MTAPTAVVGMLLALALATALTLWAGKRDQRNQRKREQR